MSLQPGAVQAEDIELKAGDYILMTTEEVEKATFIIQEGLVQPKTNKQIELGLDEVISTRLNNGEDISFPIKLNISANTLVITISEPADTPIQVLFEKSAEVLSDLISPNFIILFSDDQTPKFELIRSEGDPIVLPTGDDPNTYVIPKEGLEIRFTPKAEEPPPEAETEGETPGLTGNGGGIPQTGNTSVDPSIFPDREADAGSVCQLHAGAPLSLSLLGFVGLAGLALHRRQRSK